MTSPVIPAGITLYGLRQMYPALFHPNQDWFEGEAFLYVPLHAPHVPMPNGVIDASPTPETILPHAVELAAWYVRYPDAALWRRYLWTCDTDHDGQRVYVGDNGRGLELHRHIHLTERFGVPTWD